jgi:hypothetical protein
MMYRQQMDRDSVVGTVARYSLEGSDYECCRGKRFSPLRTCPE